MYIAVGTILLFTIVLTTPWITCATKDQLAKVAQIGFLSLAVVSMILLGFSGRFSAFLIGILAFLPFISSVLQIWQKRSNQHIDKINIT